MTEYQKQREEQFKVLEVLFKREFQDFINRKKKKKKLCVKQLEIISTNYEFNQ